jgi:hypothetical protein
VDNARRREIRTVASYVNSVFAQGFYLVHLEERGPNHEQIAEHPENH